MWNFINKIRSRVWRYKYFRNILFNHREEVRHIFIQDYVPKLDYDNLTKYIHEHKLAKTPVVSSITIVTHADKIIHETTEIPSILIPAIARYRYGIPYIFLSSAYTNLVNLKSDIDTETAKRFILFHEVGHLVLHSRAVCKMGLTYKNNKHRISSLDYLKMEYEANEFAYKVLHTGKEFIEKDITDYANGIHLNIVRHASKYVPKYVLDDIASKTYQRSK